jgi:hypothetical protein
MFILTFIITDCGIVFSVHIVSCVYKLPMGYAYYCFIFSIIFSIIDWGLSLKRVVSKLRTKKKEIIIIYFNVIR